MENKILVQDAPWGINVYSLLLSS